MHTFKQGTVLYTQRLILDHALATAERMRVEQSEECFFLFVYASISPAMPELRGKHPLSKLLQLRTTGRPSLHCSLWLVYASILTPPRSVKLCKLEKRGEIRKLLISPGQEWQNRPRASLWLLFDYSVSAMAALTVLVWHLPPSLVKAHRRLWVFRDNFEISN